MRRSLVFLIVLALVLVTGLWWMFLISPKNQAIADAETRLEDAESQEVLLRTQIKRLQDIKDAEVSYIVAIGEIEQSLPERPELAAFIDDVTLLASRTGVNLDSISPSAPSENTTLGFYEMPVGLLIQGEFFEVLGFLYGIEAMDRLVRVDGISLSRTEAAAGTADEETESTETETEETQRGAIGELSVSIITTLFTRSPVALPVTPIEEEEGES
jgi:Tfp pilus assembly protein PilO